MPHDRESKLAAPSAAVNRSSALRGDEPLNPPLVHRDHLNVAAHANLCLEEGQRRLGVSEVARQMKCPTSLVPLHPIPRPRTGSTENPNAT